MPPQPGRAKGVGHLSEEFVIKQIFPKSLSIADYIALITGGREGSSSISLVTASDKRAFIDFCTTDVFIVPEDAPVMLEASFQRNTADSSDGPRKTSLKDLLNKFIVEYVRGAKYDYRTQNCLTFGYRLKCEGSVGMTNNMDIECLHINTLHSILLSSPSWSLLAYRLGEVLFNRILVRPVVAKLPNGCFMQLCGMPVGNLVYLTSSASVEAHVLFKYQHKSSSSASNKFKSPLLHSSRSGGVKAADQSSIKGSSQVPRYGIFYKNIYQRQPGLPKRHILSKRLTSSEQLAAHVYGKYVVPANAVSLKQMFRHIIRNLKNCDVHKALKRYCPLPSNGRVHATALPFMSIGGEKKGVVTTEADLLAIIESTHMVADESVSRLFDAMENDGNGEEEEEGDDDEGDDDIYEDNEFMTNFTSASRKRRRRGCRGSGFLRRKQRSITSASVSAGAMGKASVGSRGSKRVQEVGGRLLNRFIASSNIDTSFKDEGLQSQQEDLDMDIEVDTGCAFAEDAAMGDEEQVILANSLERFVYDVASSDENFDASNLEASLNPRGTPLPILCSTTKAVPSSIPSTFTSDSGTAHHILLRRMPIEPSLSTASQDGATRVGKSRQRPAAAKKSYVRPASSSALDKTGPIDCYSPHEQVSSFVKSICRRTFSKEHVWGSRKNLKIFMRAIDTFVSLGRQEIVTIECLRKGVGLSSLPFFVAGNDAGLQRDNQRMLDILVYWIFSDFVSPLLGVCFYATEAEGRGNQVLYYRKPVWSRVVSTGRDQIYKHFVELKVDRHGKGASAGKLATFYTSPSKRSKNVTLSRLPSIRFIPKKNLTVRPITNFRSRLHPQTAQGKSSFDDAAFSNSALNNCLQILKHICNKNPHLAGFGAFGADEIYLKFRSFKKILQDRGDFYAERLSGSTECANTEGNGGEFYIAVLDLEKCYDNVDTSLLYNLVRDLLRGADGGRLPLKGVPREAGGEFVVQKYSVSHHISSMEKNVSKPLRHVATDGDIVDFKDASARICSKVSNAIIGDHVQYSKLSVAELLGHVRDHLFMHYVKMPFTSCGDRGGGKHSSVFGEQVKGIPQGSVLSSLLCNLYYGNAERVVFGSRPVAEALGLVDQSMIIRYMDDYIMISLQRSCVHHFLQMAHVALSAFGGGVNAQKTRVNFDCEIELGGSRVALQKVQGRDVHWCGYCIDSVTLEVRPSFKRMLEMPLAASVTADRSMGNAGLNIRRNIKTFIRMKLHALLFDSHINSRKVVLLNVYTTHLLAAMRTHCYMSRLGGGTVTRNRLYFSRCVEEGVLFGAQLVSSRVRAGVPKQQPLDEEDGEEEEEGLSEYSYFRSEARAASELEPAACSVTRREAQWLGARAFIAALGRHRSSYKDAIACLEGMVASLRRGVGAAEAEMCEVCAQGDALMDHADW